MKMEVTHIKTNIKEVIEKSILPSSLEIGAGIASQAKLLAPVDQGQLRNSLSASSLKNEQVFLNNKAGEQAQPLQLDGLKANEVYSGSNSDHVVFQEFGTVNQPAQPFLRPAQELVTGGAKPAEIVQKYGREMMERELKTVKEVRRG